MSEKKVYRSIGLMSGTSLDGIDAAMIETDGYSFVKPLGFVSIPYEQALRDQIRACFGTQDVNNVRLTKVERALTLKHAQAVRALVKDVGCALDDVDVIGFHGQTIHHDPKKGMTLQIGDGALLACELGVDVVHDFRSADIAAGGQGAPLIPLYHLARIEALDLPRPIAVLNIGGIANVTYIGAAGIGEARESEVIAFDTGPGNALLDDFIYTRQNKRFDEGGVLAKSGTVEEALVETWMAMPYFTLPVPKSLDRNEWDVSAADYLSDEDGAATLAAFSVEAIVHGASLLPKEPQMWLVCGGGRHNRYFIDYLQLGLMMPVKPVEDVGWNGDAIEAEGFAYLAVRSILGEALSLPMTTGVPGPQSGGVLSKAR